jgi:hypothetical protein
MNAQTEAARADMRFARQYLEHDDFASARRHVVSARQKDPNVTLDIKTTNQRVGRVTPNSLEAEILVMQASDYHQQLLKLMHDEQKKDDNLSQDEVIASIDYHLQQGTYLDGSYRAELRAQYAFFREERIKCLAQAVQLESNVPIYHAMLGGAYLDNRNHDAAVQVLTGAKQKWPEDFDIHRALDTALTEQKAINSTKNVASSTTPQSNGGLIIAMIVLTGIVLFFVLGRFLVH